jgi:hypothetical protein
LNTNEVNIFEKLRTENLIEKVDIIVMSEKLNRNEIINDDFSIDIE